MIRRALLAVLLFAAAAANAQLAVRYRTENTIYINAGTAAGVTVGDRFEVVRAGNVIATIEVQFAAEQSASARIVTESTPIQAGDAVRRIGAPVAPQPQPAPAMPGLGGGPLRLVRRRRHLDRVLRARRPPAGERSRARPGRRR
jgi:hypothetical protein